MTAVVGRDQELAAGEEFLDSAAERFGVLLLEGEAGIGKTTVWQELAERARARGMRVLQSRPAAAEAKLSLAGIGDLLAEVPARPFDSLPAPQRRAIDVALLRADAGDAPLDERAVAAAFRTVLAELAAETPVLVAVDDVQWLDRPSAEVLEFALRRVGGNRVAFLLSRRVPEPLPLSLEETSVTRLPVGPLSVAGVHHVVKERLGHAFARPTLVRIHEATAGNPLFALEVARLLEREGVPPPGEPLPVPEDVASLVEKRVRRLPDETREVLLAAAALAEPSEDTLRTALGRRIYVDLAPAERENIARLDGGAVVFSHPLFAGAIYAAVTSSERAATHRRLAEAVREKEQRARHLALGVEGRDEEVALELEAAARELVVRGTPGAAAELQELAVELGQAEGEKEAERVFLLADYLGLANETERAQSILESRSWAEASAAVEGQALAGLVNFVYWVEGPAVAAEVGRPLLERATRPLARSILLAELAMYCEADLETAARYADEALELMAELGDEADPVAEALALTFRARNRLVLGEGFDRSVVDQVREVEARIPEGRDRLVLPSSQFGQWLKYVDELDESRELLEAEIQRDLEVGFERGAFNKMQHLTMTECWAGNLERARELALPVSEAADAPGMPRYAPAILAIVEAHRGDAEAVYALRDRLRREGWDRTIHLDVALGLLELSLGNDAAADEHYRLALEAAEDAGHREPGIHRIHANAAEVAVSLGDRERAEQLAEYLERHGERTGHRWSLATGARVGALLAASRGDLESALARAERAMTAHSVLPMPFETGRTLLVKGQIERRLRKRGAAKRSFEEALSIFDEIGATLWAERARAELERTGIRRSATGDELTEAERRVAELVASGLTNREVADALFMSPKTVEVNLSRIYRKLGISSRAQLGARMAESVQT